MSIKKIIYLSCLFFVSSFQASYDLTVIGYAKFANSLARLPIAHIDCLKDYIKINHIDTRPGFGSFDDIPLHVRYIMQHPDKAPGRVSLLDETLSVYTYIPYQNTIKLAYSMVEFTKLPTLWASRLNTYFDAVVVPDKWLVDVYKRSGVTIPIFVLPCPLYLKEFLALPPKIGSHSLFTFGISSTFASNKNVSLLLEAFAKEFGNARNILLKIHTPWNYRVKEIQQKIKQLQLTNVLLTVGQLPWRDYVAFIASLDCYVLLSKGEGFSITPREALAAGIPCIITNNTAHKTICDTGFVRAVDSLLMQRHEGEFYGEPCGYNFNCTLHDACQALRDVYENYAYYLQRAHQARDWVKQYLPENMVTHYLALIKPKKVILGFDNKLEDECMVTNSDLLYKKYNLIK